MEYTICSDCDYCKTDRKNEQGQVRCTRFSQFVNRNQKSCEAFYNEKYYNEKHGVIDNAIGTFSTNERR